MKLLVGLAMLASTAFAQGKGSAKPTEKKPHPRPTTENELAAEVAAEETAFFEMWRNTWMLSMDSVLRRTDASLRSLDGVAAATKNERPVQLRYNGDTIPATPSAKARMAGMTAIAADLHCHWDGSMTTNPRMIRSAYNAQAACPGWAVPDSELGARAVFVIAPRVRAAMRDSVDRRRREFLAFLDSSAMRFPGNAFLVGQQVRFALDSGDIPRARRLSASCTANTWWCSALAGYVLALEGKLLPADSAFGIATAATASEARCQWTDVRGLLPHDARAAYRTMPCEARDSISRLLFWLADPMLSEPGNERRVEHFARQVALYLHNAILQDEIYTWAPEYGGDALSSTVGSEAWNSRDLKSRPH